MVTHLDPATNADAAREALRALAHTTRNFADPAETYRVMGALSAGLASLIQSIDQLADWHYDNAPRAAEAGSPQAGQATVRAAADDLHDAATMLEQARCRLEAAWSDNGRVTWQSPASTAPPAPVRRLALPSSFGHPPAVRDGGLGR